MVNGSIISLPKGFDVLRLTNVAIVVPGDPWRDRRDFSFDVTNQSDSKSMKISIRCSADMAKDP